MWTFGVCRLSKIPSCPQTRSLHMRLSVRAKICLRLRTGMAEFSNMSRRLSRRLHLCPLTPRPMGRMSQFVFLGEIVQVSVNHWGVGIPPIKTCHWGGTRVRRTLVRFRGLIFPSFHRISDPLYREHHRALSPMEPLYVSRNRQVWT